MSRDGSLAVFNRRNVWADQQINSRGNKKKRMEIHNGIVRGIGMQKKVGI